MSNATARLWFVTSPNYPGSVVSPVGYRSQRAADAAIASLVRSGLAIATGLQSEQLSGNDLLECGAALEEDRAAKRIDRREYRQALATLIRAAIAIRHAGEFPYGWSSLDLERSEVISAS
jgi:hypothetical protein